MIAILAQDRARLVVRRDWRREWPEGLRVVVDHREDGQRDARVAAGADALVVAELGEGFAGDRVRYDDGSAVLTRGEDAADRPAMMLVAAIDGRDEQTAVGECRQRSYTVASTVAERSAGPSSDPR